MRAGDEVRNADEDKRDDDNEDRRDSLRRPPLIAARLRRARTKSRPAIRLPEAAVKDLVDSWPKPRRQALVRPFYILGKDGAALLEGQGDADEDAENLQKEFNEAAAAETAIDERDPMARRSYASGRTAGPCRCRSSRPTRRLALRRRQRKGEMTNRRAGYNEPQRHRSVQKAYVKPLRHEYFRLGIATATACVRMTRCRFISTPEPMTASTGRRRIRPIFSPLDGSR